MKQVPFKNHVLFKHLTNAYYFTVNSEFFSDFLAIAEHCETFWIKYPITKKHNCQFLKDNLYVITLNFKQR